MKPYVYVKQNPPHYFYYISLTNSSLEAYLAQPKFCPPGLWGGRERGFCAGIVAY